jgi:hypothetical protein
MGVDAELLFERALDVDLGEHAEPFGLKRLGDAGQSLIVRGRAPARVDLKAPLRSFVFQSRLPGN